MRKGFIRAGAAGLAVGLLASCGSGGRGGAYEECDPDYTSSVKASEEEIADALAFGDSYIADPEAETGFNHWGGDYVRLPGEVACIGADDEKYFTKITNSCDPSSDGRWL
mgnify:CR=1 FL=1